MIGPMRSLALVEGEVKHSAEGYKQGMLDIIHDPNVEKSWPISIFKAGPPHQHYELEDVCWISDGPTNNTKYIGTEREGVKGEPLTDNQLQHDIRLSKELRILCPKMAANPPTRGVNLIEHREIANTSCPSGRIPWAEIIAGITQPQEEDWMSVLTDDQQRDFYNKTVAIWNVLHNTELGIERWAYWQILLQAAAAPDGGTVADTEAVAEAVADEIAKRAQD